MRAGTAGRRPTAQMRSTPPSEAPDSPRRGSHHRDPTTTLRMVLGLVHPTAGQATIGGLPYHRLHNPTLVVGAALESASFHPARTARNHLRILCTVAGLPMARADEVLERVGLHDAARRKVRGYSMGMRQRLSLAAALLGDPRVIVLDEPANGLDPEGIRWLRGLLRRLADQGRTVLISSHQLIEVEAVADRVVILNRGRFVRQGTIAELTAGSDVVVVRTPTPDPLAAAVSSDGGTVAAADGNVLRISGLTLEAVGHLAFGAGVELHELSALRSDLEDVFFALTAEEAAE